MDVWIRHPLEFITMLKQISTSNQQQMNIKISLKRSTQSHIYYLKIKWCHNYCGKYYMHCTHFIFEMLLILSWLFNQKKKDLKSICFLMIDFCWRDKGAKQMLFVNTLSQHCWLCSQHWTFVFNFHKEICSEIELPRNIYNANRMSLKYWIFLASFTALWVSTDRWIKNRRHAFFHHFNRIAHK